MKCRRWMRRLCVFYKIKRRGHPEKRLDDEIIQLIPAKSSSYNTLNSDHIENIIAELIFLNIHFFLIRLSNGTDWTTSYVIQNPTVFLRIHY